MTDASRSTTAPAARALALRACGLGLAACAVVLAFLLATGVVAAEVRGQVLLGVAAAALTGSIGLIVQTRLSTSSGDDPKAGSRFVVGIVANLLLQAGTVVIGCLALQAAGAKFEGIAAFGLAFAGAATLLHTAGVAVVSRALLSGSRGGALPARAQQGHAR